MSAPERVDSGETLCAYKDEKGDMSRRGSSSSVPLEKQAEKSRTDIDDPSQSPGASRTSMQVDRSNDTTSHGGIGESYNDPDTSPSRFVRHAQSHSDPRPIPVPVANMTSFCAIPPGPPPDDEENAAVDRTTPTSAVAPGEPKRRINIQDKSAAFQVLFVTITCATQLLAQGQFGMVLIPLNDLGPWLGTDDAGQMSWMAASYGLTLGIFVVVSGRLGDMFGPKLVWSIGCIFGIASNVGSGFCKSPIPFDICRAIAGLGSALSLPNALAILGRTYPPGKIRNIVFAILGALAPAGFIVGGAVASIFTVLVDPRWVWWFTAIFIFVFLISGIFILPSDGQIPSSEIRLRIRSFDYIGTALLMLALGLFNFVWNQAPLVGWEQPYVYVLLIVSILGFVAFFFYERRLGKDALIPLEVLGRQSLLVYLTLWLGWMSFGTFLLYSALFIHNIREHHNALLITAQLSPLMPGGIAAAMLVPFLIHRFAGHHIFLASMISFFIGNLFAALTPKDQMYWGLTFFSLIICVFGPDLSFSTGQLIVSNSVNHEFQGIAAGIVSMITNYSLSIGLGMAGTVERYVKGPGESQEDLLKGYRGAFWTATGLAALAVIVVALFVRTPRQTHGHEKDRIVEKRVEEGR